jgi:hypothetical protein
MIDEFYSRDKGSRTKDNGGKPTAPFSVSDAALANADTHKPKEDKNSTYSYFKPTYQWIRFTVGPWIIKRIVLNSGFWTAAATVVIAVATIVYTHYARKQWQEMHDSGTDTHALAQQAVTQGTLLRQQIVGTYAAAIPKSTPAPAELSNDLEFLRFQGIDMSFTNVGKTKATGFIADATLIRKTLPNYTPIGIPEYKHISQAQIRPNDQNGPNSIGDTPVIRFNTKALTERDIASLQNLRETIEIDGHFQYGNGFDDTVKEAFCFLYVGQFPQHIFTKSGASTGGGGGGWTTCDDKEFIEQAVKWKQKQQTPN